MTIEKCITKYPQIAEKLFEMGFHCIGCHAAQFETLEEGLKGHGYSEKEIEKTIKEFNKIIKNE